jgi:hypothetical protein
MPSTEQAGCIVDNQNDVYINLQYSIWSGRLSSNKLVEVGRLISFHELPTPASLVGGAHTGLVARGT